MLLRASSEEWFENGEEYRGHWIQQHLLCPTLQHGTDAHYSTLLCLILNGARDGISCSICYFPAKEPDTSVRDYMLLDVWDPLSASFQVINIHFQRQLKRWEWERSDRFKTFLILVTSIAILNDEMNAVFVCLGIEPQRQYAAGSKLTINTTYKLFGRKRKKRRITSWTFQRKKLIFFACFLPCLCSCFTHWMLFVLPMWSLFCFASGLIQLGALVKGGK